MTPLTKLAEWQALKAHQKEFAAETLQNAFQNDPHRFEKYSLQLGGILLDYSKNYIKQDTMPLLSQLAKAIDLPKQIEDLFMGEPLNSTEFRAALHTALRHQGSQPVLLNGVNVMPAIKAALQQMTDFTRKIHDGTWRGVTGKPIRDIVNIGIGGSHLGPLMATHALSDFAHPNLHCHFVSNIDQAHLKDVLRQIDPEAVLFIISSKSFSTLETMTNAKMIRTWLQQKLGVENVAAHFVAVTSVKDKAIEFGIPAEQIFPLWDWVGGRYSVWSAIGLPLALLIGMERFQEFLNGAYSMDVHFRNSEFTQNMPVVLALLGIWYINFFGAKSHVIVPYAHQLNYFRSHLQQLDMESNGKRMTHAGDPIDYSTGPIIWGEHGGIGQHAFHQLLHQGQHIAPVDFMLIANTPDKPDLPLQDILIASALSQAQALLQGKTFEQAFEEARAEGYSENEAKCLAAHKAIPGNRPSNILFLDQLTPFNLGALLALYEHKTFVQGAIWKINSFDQWGVELGKQLLPAILSDLHEMKSSSQHDASTAALIKHYKKLRGTK